MSCDLEVTYEITRCWEKAITTLYFYTSEDIVISFLRKQCLVRGDLNLSFRKLRCELKMYRCKLFQGINYFSSRPKIVSSTLICY